MWIGNLGHHRVVYCTRLHVFSCRRWLDYSIHSFTFSFCSFHLQKIIFVSVLPALITRYSFVASCELNYQNFCERRYFFYCFAVANPTTYSQNDDCVGCSALLTGQTFGHCIRVNIVCRTGGKTTSLWGMYVVRVEAHADLDYLLHCVENTPNTGILLYYLNSNRLSIAVFHLQLHGNKNHTTLKYDKSHDSG